MYVNLARRMPLATTSLIAMNIIILGLGLLSGSQLQIIRDYGFIPNNLFHIKSNNLVSDVLTRLFTSMFIHSGVAHLAFNVLALGYLGGYAERSVGVPRYLLIYMLAGIAGALFHSVIASYILGSGHVILIGASGGNFRCLRNSGCCRECKSILLALITNYICDCWFFYCHSNRIHRTYWWFYYRSNSH